MHFQYFMHNQSQEKLLRAMNVFFLYLLDYHIKGIGKRCCLPKDPQGINITFALCTIHVYINQTHLLQTLPCTLIGQWLFGYGFIDQPNHPKMAAIATMATMATMHRDGNDGNDSNPSVLLSSFTDIWHNLCLHSLTRLCRVYGVTPPSTPSTPS